MIDSLHTNANITQHACIDRVFRTTVRWLAVVGAICFSAVFLFGAVTTILYQPWLVKVAIDHFAATIGLPFSALAALCLVVVLEITAGSVQIKAFGIEFKGAAGPIIMWILVFMAIATAIKMLW